MPRRALLALIAVIACMIVGFVWLWPIANPRPVLPQGEQTLTGTVNRAPLSLTRRGTHVLSINGERVTMLESTTVALDKYEGKAVTLHGTFEANTDAVSLPVLVVTGVDDVKTEYRPEAVPSLGLTFSVPSDWTKDGQEPAFSFTASGSSAAVLRLEVLPGVVLPSDSNLSISSRLATRRIDAKSGSGVITVQLDQARILALRFAPLAPDPVTALEQLSQIVRTLKFASNGSGTVSAGTGALLPCGGTAGILCPKGSYCQIIDAQNRVGTCAPLSNQ